MSTHIEKSASRYILVSLSVVLFVTAMILVILQSSYFRNLQIGAKNTYFDGYVEGFEAARELAYSAGLPHPESRTALTGKVISVGSSDVTFNAIGLVMDDLVDEAGLLRTVYVTQDTKIVLQKNLPTDEFIKKQNEYAEKIAKRKPDEPLPAPPLPYNESAITLKDIQPGDLTGVISVNNQDILNLPTFYVSKISVTRQ